MEMFFMQFWILNLYFLINQSFQFCVTLEIFCRAETAADL